MERSLVLAHRLLAALVVGLAAPACTSPTEPLLPVRAAAPGEPLEPRRPESVRSPSPRAAGGADTGEDGDSLIFDLLADIGLPGDAPIALSTRRSGPPDPVETGAASLTLRLLDRENGDPLESEVILWRIGAPANVYWTAGDQEVARAKVPIEGHRFAGLAIGEYRPVVLRERAYAPHAPPVIVAGATNLDLPVDPARDRPVRLALAHLAPTVAEVQAYRHPLRTRCGLREPVWVVRREVQPDFDGPAVILFGPYDLGASWQEEGSTWLRRTPSGFDGGTHPEDTRWCTYTRELTLRTAGPGTEYATIEIRNPPPSSEPVEILVIHPRDE